MECYFLIAYDSHDIYQFTISTFQLRHPVWITLVSTSSFVNIDRPVVEIFVPVLYWEKIRSRERRVRWAILEKKADIIKYNHRMNDAFKKFWLINREVITKVLFTCTSVNNR